jgi:hypothetical protein
MPLLHPSQRKSFTITKDTAVWLASQLANGRKLRFQSYANRNWVAKIARTRYGVDTKSYVTKDQLFDPSSTVEGFDIEPGSSHYMNLYCAEMVAISQPAFIKPEPAVTPTTYMNGNIVRVPTYNRREDYVR